MREGGMMRATVHNGRKGKDGTYSAKHNDRNYDIETDSHIEPKRENGNWYWNLYGPAEGVTIKIDAKQNSLTFEEAEQKYYESSFRAALDAQNARHIARGQKSRVRTMEQYRQSYKTCPEETLYYIGSKKDGTINRDTLLSVVSDQLVWEQRTFPAIQILDLALHMDEGGAPHIHERKVWLTRDKDGNPCVGQAAALKEMGIARPHPEKKEGRYNNAKITYTKLCRDHFLELCHAHGLEIIEEPQDKSKSGLELDDYKAQQAQEKAARAEEQARQAEQQRKAAEMAAEQQRKAADKAKADKEKADRDAQKARESVQKAAETLSALRTEKSTIEGNIAAKTADLSRLDDSISAAEETAAQARRNAQEARQQQLDALRDRDTARADLDVTERLQTLSGDFKSATPPDVEILRETDAKTTILGKEIPATVTIKKGDFEELREKAKQIDLMQKLVARLESSLEKMREWAQLAFTNKIDAKEILVNAKVQEESQRADHAESQLAALQRDNAAKDAKIKYLSADLDQVKAENRETAELRKLFPMAFKQMSERKRVRAAEYAYDQMVCYGQTYPVYDGQNVSLYWLLNQYVKECRSAGVEPRSDMTVRLQKLQRNRGIYH